MGEKRVFWELCFAAACAAVPSFCSAGAAVRQRAAPVRWGPASVGGAAPRVAGALRPEGLLAGDRRPSRSIALPEGAQRRTALPAGVEVPLPSVPGAAAAAPIALRREAIAAQASGERGLARGRAVVAGYGEDRTLRKMIQGTPGASGSYFDRSQLKGRAEADVRSEESGGRHETLKAGAALLRSSPPSAVVRKARGLAAAVLPAVLAHIEVAPGAPGRGALIGAIVGAAAGWLVGLGKDNAHRPPNYGEALVCAVFFAAMGAILGYFLGLALSS